MLQIARIARAHYAHTSAVPLSLLRRPAPPSAYVSRPAPSFPYPSSSAHSKKMATAVASTMPANLSWSTASAQAAGLDMALLEKISTVFVPSDEAIKVYASSAGSGAADLLSGPAGKAAVSAHVIPNVALSLDDLPEGNSTYPTVAGQPLIVTKKGTSISVSADGSTRANVTKPNISIGNAVLFVIDRVLVPIA